MTTTPVIEAIFVGQPKTLTDAEGTWQSSIYRDLVSGPIMLEKRGLVGDKATQPYHGSPESAVCCHSSDHYRFWNERYQLALEPGNVGENWTLADADEAEICIGDIYRVGGATVQVSAPRIPCNTQARRIGRADWVKLTLQELRTGFYMRVLEPGLVEAGQAFNLQERPNPGGSVQALNRCYYHQFDPVEARKLMAMVGLMAFWQQQLQAKFGQKDDLG